VREKFRLNRRWFFQTISDFVEIGRHDNHPETGARFAALAPKLFPMDPESWSLYARALRSLDDEPRVLSVLKEGALKTNDAASILSDIVASHLRLGHPRLAEEVMDRFKDDYGGWKHLSWAYIHADQHDWEAMIGALDESMERAEMIDLPDRQITAGILTASAPGGREAAIELLQRALEAKEDLLGRVVLAHLIFETSPEDALAHITRARALWTASEKRFGEYMSSMGWKKSGGTWEID
jgi:tetratricopeptide (TPR) repeat protein